MEPAFRPAPLEALARWIFGALDAGGPVLGIPRENFRVPGRRLASTLQGRTLAAPLGLAAGPHTQLAQNMVAGWLCGARFIELKTVQILDRIEVPRPCIDADDETYNREWSQELGLSQSYAEYLHAWVLIHALAGRLGLPEPGTLFAMSVGYDLAGMQSAPVQRFIASMRDARAALPAAIEAVARAWPAVRDVPIPHRISDHVTLSTMHGCPPEQIERIARFLLCELGVHTWVKLNPTLLGPKRVRALLERGGSDAVVPDDAFAHDPRFEEAMAMVERLAAAARGTGLQFGLKLSNTLEVENRRPAFPGEKTSYLSGRALHPLTLLLAQRVDEAQGGRVPISFCGGADAGSFADLVADGLSPITVCTDLLKPGGVARLSQYVDNLEAAMERAGAADVDAFIRATSGGKGAARNLAAHAARIAEPRQFRRERPLRFKGGRPLGRFDCIAAPCQEACPAHQNVPDYLWLVARGRTAEALEVIQRANPLPGVTGSACDHPCTERCVRIHYDAPLAIREVKRFAFEQGGVGPPLPAPSSGPKVAIVGAGPAGLSAAEALARMGFAPEIFEARAAAGGMVGNVIPAYRMAPRALEADLARLRALGVAFHFGRALGRDFTLDGLRGEFRWVFLGVGLQRGKRLGIPGDDAPGVVDALGFLEQVHAGVVRLAGRSVLVVGGGNSAMDAARTARRLLPQAEVTLVYRRTRAQMPAQPEELRDCLDERIGLRELLAPARVVIEEGRVAGLACTRMALGPKDPSGRARAVPIDGPEVVLPAEAVIAAIGQEPRLESGDGLARRPDGAMRIDERTGETSLPGVFAGGDVVRGPASIIHAIADGRRAAAEIGRRCGVALAAEPPLDKRASPDALLARKASLQAPRTVPVLPPAGRGGFAEVIGAFDAQEAAAEASRCLDCDELCSLCVTVCPNRANLAFAAPPLRLSLPRLVSRAGRLVAEGAQPFALEQAVQIVNLGDFCNQCGNCETFCPTAGAPWRDKPRFWLDREGFAAAPGDAFRLEREAWGVAIEARLAGATHRLERRGAFAEYRSDRLSARIALDSGELIEHAAAAPPAEGEAIDPSPCATLMALLGAEAVLP